LGVEGSVILGLLIALAWYEVPGEIDPQTRAGKPYAQAFREVVGGLDDATAALAARAIRDQPALISEDDSRRYLDRERRAPGSALRPSFTWQGLSTAHSRRSRAAG
jgi:hypothetical protein